MVLIVGNVQTVAFYGEDGEWSTAALLHSEPLVERSRLHAWRISPHRHSSLVQVFWLAAGHGTARFDADVHELRAPCVAVVPENCVHEFDWSHDCDGFALSLASALVQELRTGPGLSDDCFGRTNVLDASDDPDYPDRLFRSIQDEYGNQAILREAALDSLIRTLAIWIARHLTNDDDRPAAGSRGSIHFSRFAALLDEHHKAQWNVADYAGAIGVSPSHLNSIAQQYGGGSAKRLIQNRLLLAARRQLTYTDKSIVDVARSVGFSDASYFTRFFKRSMHMTPKEYRRRSGTLAGID